MKSLLFRSWSILLQSASEASRCLLLIWILVSGFLPLQAQQLPEDPPTLLEGDSGLHFETAPSGEKILHWLGRADRTYFIQASSDLLDWTWAPNIESGIDGPMSYEVDGPTTAGFFRLQYTDQTAEDPDSADFDDDGLSSNFELTPRPRPGGIVGYANLNPNIQTNPLRADTDGDGLSDKWELEHGFDPTDDGTRLEDNGPNGDPDQDGVTNLKEYQSSTNPKSSADFPAQIISVFRWATGGGLTATTSSNESVYYHAASWVPASYSETVADYFSILELTAMAETVAFPVTPPTSDHHSASDYPQTGIFQTSSSYLSADSEYAAGIISQSRSWLQVPAKNYPQKHEFIKSSRQQIIDSSGTVASETTTAEVVTLEIPANQTLSAPIDIKPIPSPATPGGRILKSDTVKALRLVSRDRYFAGAVDVSVLGKEISAEFINTTTGENLGTFSDLERNDGNTKIFSHVTKVLDPDASPGERQPVGQKVWFVREADGLNFYTCFSEVGEIEIRLKAQSTHLVTLHHTLTSAADFSEVIDYVNDWVTGSSFPAGSIPVTTTGPTSVQPGIDYLTSACLIPLFNVVGQVEGLTAVFVGLYDGVKAGLIDDRDFLLLIGNSVVHAGNYAVGQAQIELNKYFNDPLKRAQEIKNLTDQFINDILFKTFRNIDRNLSNWDGFKDKSWAVWEAIGQAATLQYTISNTLWNKVVNGLCDWHQDFNNRMAIGSEQVHWGKAFWVKDKLLANVDEIAGSAMRTAAYTVGYSSGYLLEQVCVAIGSDGVYTLAKVAVKGVIKLGSSLSLRTAFALGTRGQLLKRWLAGASVSTEMYFTAERGLADASTQPISGLIKDTAAEVFETTMRKEAYDRSIYGFLALGSDVAASPRLQALFLIEKTEARFWRMSAMVNKLLGDETSAQAMKGWVRVYDRCLKIEGGALVEDRAEDLFKLMKLHTQEGQKALRKSLEEFAATDGTGKFWLRDVEKLQAEGYRYSNFDPRFDVAGNSVPGPPKLKAADAPDGGWYGSFDKFDAAGSAKASLQLPPDKTAKFRLEFDWDAVKNNVRIPRGDNHRAEWLEMLAKDFPANGAGGYTQITVEGIDVPIKSIWDISGSSPVKIY